MVCHTPLCQLFVKYLREYSAKIEIVPECLEEFFDENNQKSCDTIPLNLFIEHNIPTVCILECMQVPVKASQLFWAENG